jgi:hypothetical protein
MRSAVTQIARHTSLAGRVSPKKVDGGSWAAAAIEVRERETRPRAPKAFGALPGTNQTGRFFITSFLQLRELDLLGSHRFGGHRPPLQQAGSSSSHSSFCEEVFSRSSYRTARMRWTGQIFWLLALVPTLAGITFSPPSPPKILEDWPNWEVVSSYSSATAPDSHGISCADPLFQARKELDREVAACGRRCKIYFGSIRPVQPQTCDRVQRLSRRLPSFPLAQRKREGSRRGFQPR